MDGIYPTLIPLLTARVLEILWPLPMLPTAVGGPVEVIRGLLVIFFVLSFWFSVVMMA